MFQGLERLAAFRGKEKETSAPIDSGVFVETEPTVAEWVRCIKPSQTQVLDYFVSLFPFSRWITSYNLQWLAGDLIAGDHSR